MYGPGSPVMWPSLLFPWSMEAPYAIWLQSAQWLQRRWCLKMLTVEPGGGWGGGGGGGGGGGKEEGKGRIWMSNTFCHCGLITKSMIVPEKSSVFYFFFLYKSKTGQIWPCHKIGQGQSSHHVNKLWWAHVPNAAYQVPWPLAISFREEKF